MIPLGTLASARVAGGAPVPPEYLGISSKDTKETTSTFAGRAFGDAAAERVLIAVITHNATDSSTVSSATIGGVAATIDAQTADKGTAVLRAEVPTGTSGDVVVTYSNNQAGPGRTCALYRLEGTVTVASTGTSLSTPGGACALSDSGDWYVAGSGSFLTSSGAYSWTNATEDYDTVVGASFFPSAVSGASDVGTGASVTVTGTCSPTPGQMYTVAAAYNIA
ncbi:MAG: hypothetical protein L0I24_17695 [Pseudonocardia sp.]|nr:hypothetical protein [Pseudonocardia sp.]